MSRWQICDEDWLFLDFDRASNARCNTKKYAGNCCTCQSFLRNKCLSGLGVRPASVKDAHTFAKDGEKQELSKNLRYQGRT